MPVRLRIKTAIINVRPRRQVARKRVYVVNPKRGVRRNVQRRPLKRAPMPSVTDDPIFWNKIDTLPQSLCKYLKPNCDISSITCFNLRRLIWHFEPDKAISECLRSENSLQLSIGKIGDQLDSKNIYVNG
ncbi:uncharacterized protein MELLADRAFT_114424 [Melampsora larici-populina 98AG31]|uniref:Uncharacterized protein n=1 Tax=Melampsora larici-populina (strain 98AG31 / pathotype 3-4-7) TaxID=747676 RepID=F4SDE5_MELLP|nr:uncharacterized protein MELLADRAFT_114424 [Melampsora larici-populina 98AG31]EGF97332.1 hypothetical protein MELLADRAFT_114424 [Melampsora larici-populina 98AG31]